MRGVSMTLAVLFVLLAGCAGRPGGVLLTSTATAPGASVVQMLVATTRSPQGAAPGELFTGERGSGTSFADIAVSIPPDAVRKIGDVQWPRQAPGDPASEFVAVRAQKLDRAQALREFTARVRAKPLRQVLIFVHGYNTRFPEAVFRLAQIVHDSGADVQPLLFTWPSRGKLLAYTYDRESATYSRDALEDVLQTLVRDGNVGEISILAHSMGNWVTLEALRQLSIRNKAWPRKIANVMLAAPDVDVDVFRKQIAEIGVKRPPFTLFVSQDDEALAISSKIWGGVQRVGAVDPQQEPYRGDFAAERLEVIDLTKEDSSDPLRHGKFAQSPQVVRDIGRRLAQGQALGDGKASVGEQIGGAAASAANTVGGAASLIVSAPIAIIDPATRETLGDQAGQVYRRP